MFGNRYGGDDLAKELLKLMELKKIASDATQMTEKEKSLQDFSESKVVDPEEFLQELDESPEVSEKIDEKISELDSLVDDTSTKISAEIEPNYTPPTYADDSSYLLDSKATEVLLGLGKIAGGLRKKGENFAADVVEATALSIKTDLIKEASKTYETVMLLNKIASEISNKGDTFTADVVRATIMKIKNNN